MCINKKIKLLSKITKMQPKILNYKLASPVFPEENITEKVHDFAHLEYADYMENAIFILQYVECHKN